MYVHVCVCVYVLATSRAASSSCWLIFPSLSVSYLTKRFKTFDLEEKEEKDELKQWPVSWPGWMIQSSTIFHLLYHHPNPIMTRM